MGLAASKSHDGVKQVKVPCLICQKNAPLIEVMQETIERLLKEKAAIRNEALEQAAQKAASWNTAMTDVLAEEIRNMKEQQ